MHRAFKSIQRNPSPEAIRPQRDLKPFITPLMTSQCQHAELMPWQGHLRLHILSITFQRVTHIFAPLPPQGHFASSRQMHSLILCLFSHHEADCCPSFATVWHGPCLTSYYSRTSTEGRRNSLTRKTQEQKNQTSLSLWIQTYQRKLSLCCT